MAESPSHGSQSQSQSGGEATSQDRDEAIRKLCVSCGADNRNNPLRVVVIGKHGSGKSSFVNSLAAALSQDRWREYARTGMLSDAGAITIVNRRYEKCCQKNNQHFENVPLPTLIDVAGLTNDPDERVEELLRLLFYGHIQEDESIMKVYTDCKQLSLEEIRRKYHKCYQPMRVDRVIFVASASAELPRRLMKCVYKAAHPNFDSREKRDVPLFGVLTHKDEVDLDSAAFKDKTEDFIKELGLILPRILICSNYCDALDPNNRRIYELQPRLDVPIVRFFHEVCDDAREVICDEETLPGTESKPFVGKLYDAFSSIWPSQR